MHKEKDCKIHNNKKKNPQQQHHQRGEGNPANLKTFNKHKKIEFLDMSRRKRDRNLKKDGEKIKGWFLTLRKGIEKALGVGTF